MSPDTLLIRQVHPTFRPNGQLTSQAFTPSPKDEGLLSVYDGDQVSPQQAFQHYQEEQKLSSCGCWGITCAEVTDAGLTAAPDPLPNFAAHAVVDFTAHQKKEHRKFAKKLQSLAEARGCLHQAAA